MSLRRWMGQNRTRLRSAESEQSRFEQARRIN
jgi:hypothetical protein